ncbi:hypothetical protein C8J56DRAFT_1118690 [Mycena floridula]|nr:hypothetical protein C8J56DRAFT_1118690 [Mycena floridula]
MKVIPLGGLQHFEYLNRGNDHVIVMAHKPGCSNCVSMRPIFEKLAAMSRYREIAFCEVEPRSCYSGDKKALSERVPLYPKKLFSATGRITLPVFTVFRNGQYCAGVNGYVGNTGSSQHIGPTRNLSTIRSEAVGEETLEPVPGLIDGDSLREEELKSFDLGLVLHIFYRSDTIYVSELFRTLSTFVKDYSPSPKIRMLSWGYANPRFHENRIKAIVLQHASLTHGTSGFIMRRNGDFLALLKCVPTVETLTEWIENCCRANLRVISFIQWSIHLPKPRIADSTTTESNRNKVLIKTPSRNSSSSSIFMDAVPCNGVSSMLPGSQKGSKLKWLSGRSTFKDLEPGCVFIPTPNNADLEIGRANLDGSSFCITSWYDRLIANRIYFGVGFNADPTVKARFESASFIVTFSNKDKHGRRTRINIKEVFPTDQKGQPTQVHYNRSYEGGVDLSAGLPMASLGTDGRISRGSDFTRMTQSRVKGQGVHSDRATWTFEEDTGRAGQDGLEHYYELHVSLAAGVTAISMEFFGKAVLKRPGIVRTMVLEIGSQEMPYNRKLDLTVSNGDDGSSSLLSAESIHI